MGFIECSMVTAELDFGAHLVTTKSTEKELSFSVPSLPVYNIVSIGTRL